MELKEILKNEHVKVLDVKLNKGESMPLHKASSDAFIINKKGVGKVKFSDREVVLQDGASLLIKAGEPHQLEILEDFNSAIVLEPEAQIDFV